MTKIVCTLDNASEEISGVKFAQNEDGLMVSEDINDETADVFLSIPGYHVADGESVPKPAASESKKPETAAQKKAREKAEAEAAAAQAASEAAQAASEAEAAANAGASDESADAGKGESGEVF